LEERRATEKKSAKMKMKNEEITDMHLVERNTYVSNPNHNCSFDATISNLMKTRKI